MFGKCVSGKSRFLFPFFLFSPVVSEVAKRRKMQGNVLGVRRVSASGPGEFVAAANGGGKKRAKKESGLIGPWAYFERPLGWIDVARPRGVFRMDLVSVANVGHDQQTDGYV